MQPAPTGRRPPGPFGVAVPMHVQRVITNETCNQNCWFCNARRPAERPEFIARAAVRERIEAARAGDPREIVLTGGEPAMRSDLGDLVQRAAAGGWLPGVFPAGDQHAGYELDAHGKRICEKDGMAVDLRVPGRSSDDVRAWIVGRLPFDKLYFYGSDRPLHLSWAPDPIGQVIEMQPLASGKLMPKVVVKGRAG